MEQGVKFTLLIYMQLIWRIVHQRGNKENIKIRLNIFYQFIKRIIVQHLTFTDFIKSLIKSVFFAFSIRYFTISFCDSMSNAIFQCRPPLRCDGIMYDTCAIRQDAARLVLYLTQCHIFLPCHNESFIFCKYTSFPRTAQGNGTKNSRQGGVAPCCREKNSTLVKCI